ncbi:membrane protein insertase YidC [Corynebacterium sp. ES2794-CONJ1]|uniref:membrane protein insertase YidC n=1 Tax=unclassified Corynebacterium TaxID=2624378 RepID=UPI0021691FDA|nr:MULTISPECIES: membrane protein insertase YidC [unclassified Corynebacterium]MCS4492575.1 membrane protein insertase YidC [Corynebacterium sp. ES2715-CONJ3]MCS4532225.1 membrane protein insertase YidC [Corynebacterium sp. ES2730-CONJ]MCU9519621.1 membrane protein insertase YidC [Corynebacterium sp. ES2794-CONJ1]
MLEIFIYPVSAVMKFWHYFLHTVVGFTDSQAWVFSIFGLIVVVRALIAPTQWFILKSGRISTIMRPRIVALHAEYEDEVDPAKLKEMARREREIQKELGYTNAAGCIPPLIQIPFFIGLYQVLLRMARPKEGLDSQLHQPIGWLTSNDVSSFLSARYGDVALPAYISMSPEQLQRLETTYEAVIQFNVPLILVAGIITSINLTISTVRNRFAMDHESRVAEVLLKWMAWAIPLVPLLLLQAGVTGPIPAAIAMYWGANNLWTLVQNATIYLILYRVMPYGEDVKQHQYTKREERLERQRIRRRMRWRRRLALVGFIVAPWKYTRHAEALSQANNYFREQKAARKERKLKRKELKTKRIQARREARLRNQQEEH